jgi:hypothetical protein
MARRSDPQSYIDYPPRQCTAKSKQTGNRCRHWAVPGKTTCRYHGGLGGGEGNIVHGMYSKRVNQSLQERYEEFLEHTDSISSLNSDIALMRAMMVDVLEETPASPEEREYQMNIFLRYMKDIRTATALKDDIESKFTVSIQTVQVFLNQVLYILQDTITDEQQLQQVIRRLRNIKLLDENKPKLLPNNK